MGGANLVLPGPRLDGASLYALFEAEGVSSTAGVPTVWLGLLDWVDGHAKEFTSLKRVIIGGSAVPAIMISQFHHKGVEVRQAWGMTETSPLGLSAALKPHHRLLPAEDRFARDSNQGGPGFGLALRVVGGEGRGWTPDDARIGAPP